MENKEKEEQLLKSAALQTANAVLVARRRAEQELVEIKEALESKSSELKRESTTLFTLTHLPLSLCIALVSDRCCL